MIAAAYVRVSSASQSEAMQFDAIVKAASARGDVLRPLEPYCDRMSGKTMARPALERLRADVRAGEIRKVYVFRLDRLTRSGVRDLLGLVDEFRGHGCEIVTLADGFDMAGPGAEIVLAVLAWAAKIERLAIGERISAARARVEAKGGAWGRPRRMSRGDVERAKAMQASGKSHRAIAVALKIPKGTISRALAGQKPSHNPVRSAPLKRKAVRGSGL